MNTNYKVGQRVKVISGANVTADIFNGMEGVIEKIQDNGTPKVMIYVDFENGYKIWCYTQNHRGITLNVEILEPTAPTPKWLPIDPNNLSGENVLAGNILDLSKPLIGYLRRDSETYQVYLKVFGSDKKVTEVTHYIPLTDLLNLPIAE